MKSVASTIFPGIVECWKAKISRHPPSPASEVSEKTFQRNKPSPDIRGNASWTCSSNINSNRIKTKGKRERSAFLCYAGCQMIARTDLLEMVRAIAELFCPQGCKRVLLAGCGIYWRTPTAGPRTSRTGMGAGADWGRSLSPRASRPYPECGGHRPRNGCVDRGPAAARPPLRGAAPISRVLARHGNS